MARLLQMPPDCVPTTYDLVVKITLPGLNLFQMGSSTELQADHVMTLVIVAYPLQFLLFALLVELLAVQPLRV